MGIGEHRRFLTWIILAVIAWWPALRTLVLGAIRDDNYSYTLLVLGVSVAMLCLERWPRPVEQKWSLSAMCAAIFVLAVAAWLNFRIPFRDGDFRLTISILLGIAFSIAIFLYTYGWAAFYRMRFPFLFSVLAVPPTDRGITALISTLQWGSADAVSLLLRLFHVPVVRDGLVFSFSKIDIEVAQECSSIRSSTILVVTTVVLAQLFLKSKWTKWTAVLVSLPIAVLKNGVRIFTLSLLAEYVSTDWLDSWVHHQGGFIFLGLGLAMMLAVIWLLRRAERPQRR